MSNIKLEELEAKYKELGQEIEKLKIKETSKVFPQVGDYYWFIPSYSEEVDSSKYYGAESDHYLQSIGNFFQYKEQAIAEYEARKVIAELKNCNGVKKFEEGECNYCVNVNMNCLDIYVECWNSNINGFGYVYFETKEYAIAAINQVGDERILKAAKWLACGEY